jgi:hypothetical protein
MTRTCANPKCRRAWVEAGPESKGATPPTLCPRCRAKLGKAPLSRLEDGREPKAGESEA